MNIFKTFFNRIAMRFKRSNNNNTTLSRQLRRSAKVEVNGKVINVVQYMRKVAVMLPPMVRNGSSVNHFANLKNEYTAKGLTGITAYINAINKKAERDAKKQGIQIIRTNL